MADAVVDNALARSNLDQLKTLLQQSTFLETFQEDGKRAEDELDALRQQIDNLRRTRANLSSELEKLPPVSLGQQVLRNGALQDSQDVTAREELERDIQNNLQLALDARALKEMTTAFRLGGKTIFTMDDGRVALRLETFAGARFHESYYIILGYDESLAQAVVHRHTIPYFIPLQEIVDQYLNEDVTIFADVVSNYVNAFVDRRYQCNDLRVQHEALDVLTTPSFDMVEFSLHHGQWDYVVRLVYDDLAQARPQRVAVTYGPQNRRDRRAETAFRTESLAQAYAHIFGSGRR